MTDEQQAAPETVAVDEAVVPEQEQPEAVETEGQVENQPAEEEGKAPEPEEDDEQVSKSKARRERRKAELERLRQAEEDARRAQERIEKVKQKAAKSNTPPKESDFSDYNEYLVALGAFQARRVINSDRVEEVEAEAEERRAEVERLRKAQEAELAQNWQAQAADARTRYADFDQVVNAPDLPVSKQMAALIATMDMGADVAYHLGTHRAEALQIARMDPLEQAMALGRIEAAVSTPKPRMKTNAPDPVSPVKPKAAASKKPEEMTADEYDKWRAAGNSW